MPPAQGLAVLADGATCTRVLVPLDGSATARRALQPGLHIAQALDCPMELVTVYDPVDGRWAQDLDDTAELLPYEKVEVVVVGAGWPGAVIAEMAAERSGTLVCMTAMHRDEVDRLVLGSVSAHVLRTSTFPILFAGPGYEPSPAAQRYDKLVVCLDGSSRAATALRVATTWARPLGIEIELVRVAAPTESSTRLDGIRDDLSQTAGTLTADDIPATATLLTGNSPADSIAELLASRPAALAVTATHGRTGLTRVLLGSVTAELLTRSPSPVLVTRTL